MYVTRPLSYYQKNPDELSLPPEGPNIGYLEVQDEESETYCCFGLCKNYDILDLPLPQNKKLTVRNVSGTGLNAELWQQLPEFNFTPSSKSSDVVVVGKWYCPFVFIKDGMVLKEQMKRSMFYEMTLEQRWEQRMDKSFVMTYDFKHIDKVKEYMGDPMWSREQFKRILTT
ncbi:hypothetical protein RND71_023529 [Anisodus tanguticus]|uniref:Uncharacterized protein n=1 Tax=Anisodus tanguticus TaxID=243964 RepID=A0AAE1RVB6_9SOLA|nr:hypothetical protein RND71_023529 [Anisodus tanguticus]